MCRRAVLDLGPTPQAAGAARRFIAATWRRWEIESPDDEISLAVSELVTNAVLHAHTPIQIDLRVAGDAAQICVRDNDPHPPVLRPVRQDLLADIDAVPAQGVSPATDERHQSLFVGSGGSVAAGRGLLIVEALADTWGVSERPGGKEVWLTVPVSWENGEQCPCEATGPTRWGEECRHIPGPWDVNV